VIQPVPAIPGNVIDDVILDVKNNRCWVLVAISSNLSQLQNTWNGTTYSSNFFESISLVYHLTDVSASCSQCNKDLETYIIIDERCDVTLNNRSDCEESNVVGLIKVNNLPIYSFGPNFGINNNTSLIDVGVGDLITIRLDVPTGSYCNLGINDNGVSYTEESYGGVILYEYIVGCNSKNEITIFSSCLPTEPNSNICFRGGSEAIGTWNCTIEKSGFWNGKPYYQMLDTNDCTTPLELGGNGLYVWWNNTSNQWEFTDELGVNTGYFFSYNENPGYLPLTDTYYWVIIDPDFVMFSSTLGNCCFCVRIEYIDAATYGGTYLDCDGITQNWIIPEAGDSYTYLCTSNPDSITWNIQPDNIIIYGECVNNECLIPTPSNICFTGGGETPGPFTCTVVPETGLINGKPYYKAVMGDCTTQFEAGSPIYIWFSVSGDYVGYWVVSELNNATFGNVFSYFGDYDINYYPIGNWESLETNYFISNSSFGDCPA
jgi:hypothetical protein